MISPHCSNTSTMICSVPFSGRPPTNTVLHPGGRSRVAGGGRFGFGGKSVQLLQCMISFTTGISGGIGGGTIPKPGIIGVMGGIPVIIPRAGSKSGKIGCPAIPSGAIPRLFIAVAHAVGSDIGSVIAVESTFRVLLLSAEGAFVLFLFLLDSPPFSVRPSVTRGPLALPNCRGSLLLAGSKGSWFNPPYSFVFSKN